VAVLIDRTRTVQYSLIVDRTHLVLVRAVLQKKINHIFTSTPLDPPLSYRLVQLNAARTVHSVKTIIFYFNSSLNSFDRN